MTKYVGAIDQGTTSTRFMIFDHAGEVVALDQMEHEQIYPQPGWVEHDPLEIWARTGDVIRGAMEKSGLTAADLTAIGITNQRETTIAWDGRDGRPLCNAIVWQDTRTDRIVNRLAADGGQGRFRKKTGLPLATYFAGPKLMWMMENVDGVREAFTGGYGMVGTVDTWLIWNLTGGPDGGQHITDPTNASRTMLMDLRTLDWDDDILAVMGLPRGILPGIRPSSDPAFYGMTRADGPVGGEVPICGDLGDQQAALVGQACYEVGEGKNTYGTGCFMLLNTGHEIVQSANGLITTVGYQFGDEKPFYALEGSIAIAGALVQWLRDNLGLIRTSPEVEEVAASVDDNGGMYIVPAFSGLFAPYWRSDARGVMVGLTRYITRGHIARAALEATAYQTREVAEAMASDSGVPLTSLKVDGGMVVNELLMQFQSDILGVPVVRPRINETTALGAAYAAGLAVGFWASVDEVREKWEASKRWVPAMDDADRKRLYDGWLKAVTRTFDWVEDAEA